MTSSLTSLLEPCCLLQADDFQPNAYLADGRSVALAGDYRAESSSRAADRVHHFTATWQGREAIIVDRVRLFDIELDTPAADMFSSGFYMPSDNAGFTRVCAERADLGKLPGGIPGGLPGDFRGGTAWREGWMTDRDAISHSMLTLRSVATDNRDARTSQPTAHLLGFVTFEKWHAYFVVHTAGETLRLSAWCDLHHATIQPGEAITLESLMTAAAADHDALLQRYAHALAKRHHPRVPAKAVTGWIDWQYYREEKTLADIVCSARAMQQLKGAGLPLEYIIVDGGWCDFASEWLQPCAKFPPDMKTVVRQIHDMGFKFGLWFAPYLSNVNTRVVKDHPQWLMKDRRTGQPVYKEKSNVGPCHVIDFSSRGAQAWLHDVVHTMVHDWGIDYLKLDGPCLAHYRDGQFADADMTPVRQVRKSLEIMRSACGEDVIIEGEGIYGPSIGLVDLQRTTQDSSTHWYTAAGQPLAKQNMHDDLASAWLHGRLWHNHRENVILRDFASPFHAGKVAHPQSRDAILTLQQMQFQLAATTLAGGAQLLSDPVEELLRSPDAMKHLFAMLPHWESSVCRPCVHDEGQPTACHWLRIDRPFESWFVLGAFNWHDRIQDITAPLAFTREEDERDASWHAFEFWTQQYLGCFTREMLLRDVPAQGCRLIALRQAKNIPQLVGSNLHMLQGAVEIRDMHASAAKLDITLDHPAMQGLPDRMLAFHLPENVALAKLETPVAHHLIDARLPNLLKLYWQSPASQTPQRFTLHWQGR